MVPEAQVTTDTATPAWNILTTDLNPRFHAVRIQCPMDDAADLQLGVVVEDNVVQFGISGAPYLETDTDNNYQFPADRAYTYHLQLDCPLPEYVHSSSNLTLLHRFQNRQFQKGMEYLLWFTPERALLPDIKLTCRFTKAGTIPTKATPHDIGQLLGFDVPEVSSIERVSKALKLIQQLDWKTSTEPAEFTKLFDFIRPGVPILDSSETETVWTHVQLGTRSDSAVAYRIPLTEGDHHFWVAVAQPQSPRIYVSAFFPYEKHLSAVASLERENVQFEGVKWPWKDSVLQCIKHTWNSDRGHALLLLTPTVEETASAPQRSIKRPGNPH